METSLLFASLLLLVVLTFCLYCARANLIPERIMPFMELDEKIRQALMRRKLHLRVTAIIIFASAALSLFTALPRVLTLLLVLGGFYCQYRIFCQRRCYPMTVGTGSHM